MGLEYLNEQKARAEQGPQPTHRPEGTSGSIDRPLGEQYWQQYRTAGKSERFIEDMKATMRTNIENAVKLIDPQTNECRFTLFVDENEVLRDEKMKVQAYREVAREMGCEIGPLRRSPTAGIAAGSIRRIRA